MSKQIRHLTDTNSSTNKNTHTTTMFGRKLINNIIVNTNINNVVRVGRREAGNLLCDCFLEESTDWFVKKLELLNFELETLTLGTNFLTLEGWTSLPEVLARLWRRVRS